MPPQSSTTTLTAGLIDVFAETPLSGNPLAVVEGADDLSEAQMRRIAGEFNQAETTFIMRSERADLKLRSFTAAGSEVGGAGHNALGAWLWLAEDGKLGPYRGAAPVPSGDIGRGSADRTSTGRWSHLRAHAAVHDQTRHRTERTRLLLPRHWAWLPTISAPIPRRASPIPGWRTFSSA